MSDPDPAEPLTPRRQLALRRAHDFLERPDFAARLAQYAGRPVDGALRMVPRGLNARLEKAVEKAIVAGLGLAIRSFASNAPRRPASSLATTLASASGAVSGFFGPSALALELPVTTTLMLRSIAEIARHHGEDLSRLEARLACLEVLGLGAQRQRRDIELGYYATRAMLARLTADASAVFVERGATTIAAPAASATRAAWPWLPYLRAFAEAGMVGACADWFAVVALFRRPFGLPIPHTAVVPANKRRIGAALGRFIANNFLSTRVASERLAQVDALLALARWIGDRENSERLAGRIARFLPEAVAEIPEESLSELVGEAARPCGDSRRAGPRSAPISPRLSTTGMRRRSWADWNCRSARTFNTSASTARWWADWSAC